MPLTHIDRTAPPGHQIAFVGAVTSAGVAALVAAGRRFGWGSRTFGVAAVWVPMTWLGTLSRVLRPRLPASVHRLRSWEIGGARLYERCGVRFAKAVARRGPVAAFNRDLHLPGDPSPAAYAALDAHMRTAEAAHTYAAAAAIVTAGWAGATGRWRAARWMLGTNLVVNVAPIMLQRYNRGLLAARAGGDAATNDRDDRDDPDDSAGAHGPIPGAADG